ncbi:unnamed protein product, partial [Meganyctiphanes norvegica]
HNKNMAGILRSGSFLRIFSGLRNSLASNTSHYEVLSAHKLYRAQFDHSILRNLAAVKPQETSSNNISSKNLEKSLSRIDKEIKWSGRIEKRDLEVILQDLKILERASSSQSLLLIRCCGSVLPEVVPEERTKLVQNLWTTLIQLKVPLDISHYNALLRVYVENEHKFSPLELLAELEQRDIKPNRVTSQRLIERYCQDGDIDGATKVLQLMKENQHPISENVFNAFIMGHSRAQDLESARGMLDMMRDAGVEPNVESYTALLIAYAEAGDINSIKAIMSDDQDAKHFLHDRELMEVILALARKGHDQYISDILEIMQGDPSYNQDAKNLILRLVNHGCDEAAQQLMDTLEPRMTDDGNCLPSGSFLIQQLVKAKRPRDTILKVCYSMKASGSNVYAFELALEAALVQGQMENALILMQTMKDEKLPIRKHYFWPFFVHYGQQQCFDKIYETMGEMQKMDIPIDLECMTQYICPMLLSNKNGGQTEEVVIYTLKQMGFTVPFIINGLVAYHINENDVASAADLLSRYRCRLTRNLRKNLLEAYANSKDEIATAAVLGQMVSMGTQEQEEHQVKEEDEDKRQEIYTRDLAGEFLVDLSNTKQAKLLEPLLKAMIERGIAISQKHGDTVMSGLKGSNKNELKMLLELLSSGTLTQQPLKKDFSGQLQNLSIDELESKHIELQIKDRVSNQVLKNLLVAYAKKHEAVKAEAIIKEIEAKEIEYDEVGINIIVMNMYIEEGNLEEALKYYAKFKNNDPENRLSYIKCLRLFNLLISNGKFEDATALLCDNNQNEGEGEIQSVHRKIQEFFSSLAEKGDIQNLKKLASSLKECNFLPKNSSNILAPVIESYLRNDDLEGAMKEYEYWVMKYQTTPGKFEITKKCIEKEDTAKLQRIMDLNTEIYGEINSLYELVFIFLDMGRIKQAEKILQTNGLRARNDKLERQLLWYYKSNNIKLMENLCQVTKNLFDVDCYMMYSHLLNAYIKEGETEKALSLWNNIQEEELQPDDDFLNRLGFFLKSHDIKVPFEFNNTGNTATSQQEIFDSVKPYVPLSSTENKNVDVVADALKKMFQNVLETNDVHRAIDLHKKVEKKGIILSTFHQSRYLELLLQHDQLDDATTHFNKMLASETRPSVKKIRFYVQKLAEAGDVENFLHMEKYLNKDLLPLISYNNNLCRTYVKAKRIDEYLAILQEEILTSKTDADLKKLEQKFPRGGIMGVLEQHPEKLDTVSYIAQEYMNRGVVVPTNSIWNYYFLNMKYSEAHSIFSKHLKSQEKLFFQPIMLVATENNNKDMVIRLLDTLETDSSVSLSSKGIVYSCLLNITCNEGIFTEALKTLQNAIEKGIALEDINHSTLQRIKTGAESCNLQFPYKIPPRRRKKDKSNSSSDD